MRPSPLVAACVVGAAAASVGAQPPADTAAARAVITPRVRALAGCYRLTVGPWAHAPRGRPTMASGEPPARFRLDTVVAARWPYPDPFAVTPATLVPYALQPAGWSAAGDSVDLTWTTGFSGVRLRLAARGDTLAGLAQTFADSGTRPYPEAEVRAVRTRCADEASSR